MVPVSLPRTVVSAAVCVAVRPQFTFPSGLPSRQEHAQHAEEAKGRESPAGPQAPLSARLPVICSPQQGSGSTPLRVEEGAQDVVSLHLV